MEDERVFSYSLMVILGAFAFLFEYWYRRNSTKDKREDSILLRSTSWRAYIAIALGVYGSIRLMIEIISH